MDDTTLRTELQKIFDAANEIIACLEHEDYEAAEQAARYIKLKAMALAPKEQEAAHDAPVP